MLVLLLTCRRGARAWRRASWHPHCPQPGILPAHSGVLLILLAAMLYSRQLLQPALRCHYPMPSLPSLPACPLAFLPQANPEGALRQHPGLLAEFEAAPWLLPSRTPALPYAGVHDFDALLKLRSQPVGGYDKSIALILFDHKWAVTTQNSSERSVPLYVPP